MRTFVRNNFLLILGAALPLVVIAFFTAITWFPAGLGEQPRYSFLFTVSRYRPGADAVFRLTVRDGKLVSEYRDRTAADNVYREDIRLYYFDAATRKVREISLEPALDKKSKSDTWQTFQIPEFANLTIDPRLTSPDGFHFDNSYRRSSGFIPELFIGSSYRNRLVIRKEKTIVKVMPGDNTFSAYHSRFIGWIENPQ